MSLIPYYFVKYWFYVAINALDIPVTVSELT